MSYKITKIKTKILTWAKKVKAIEILGGKCKICGDYNIFHLTFHHINPDDKDYCMNHIKDYRWSIIEKEIKKCELLCHNCHNELHYDEQETKKENTNKRLFLEIKNNINGCEICGYNKNRNRALHIHHLGKKTITFGKCKITTIGNITDEILEELNSCQVLCSNCHAELNNDLDFFNEHKEEIYEKSKNIIELPIPAKIDVEKVRDLYLNKNITQKEIAKILGCKHNSICDVIKRLNINKEYRVDKELILKLHSEGLSNSEIAKQANCNTKDVRYHVNKNKKS